MVATAAGRVAMRRAGSNRLLRAAWTAARTTAGSVARVLHLLWLEVTGVFFLAFAGLGAVAWWHEYRLHGWMYGRTLLASAFTLLFVWFGVTSFWRARKRS